jgi:hypothetical protein
MSCKGFITHDVASYTNGIIETIHLLSGGGIPHFLQVGYHKLSRRNIIFVVRNFVTYSYNYR